MSRSPIVVEPVDPLHPEPLLHLWVDGRVSRGASLDAAMRLAEGRVQTALQRTDVHCLMATRDGVPVGYVVLTERVFGLSDHADLAIDQLYVDGSARRSGVARQLLVATVQLAERLGADRVIGHVPAGDREANRFFARLGFGSSVIRRTITTAALRRRVIGGADVAAMDNLVRRRRLRAQRRAQSA